MLLLQNRDSLFSKETHHVTVRWEAHDRAGMGRVACGGGGRGKFGLRGTEGVWSVEWRLSERESGKCESEKC